MGPNASMTSGCSLQEGESQSGAPLVWVSVVVSHTHFRASCLPPGSVWAAGEPITARAYRESAREAQGKPALGTWAKRSSKSCAVWALGAATSPAETSALAPESPVAVTDAQPLWPRVPHLQNSPIISRWMNGLVRTGPRVWGEGGAETATAGKPQPTSCCRWQSRDEGLCWPQLGLEAEMQSWVQMEQVIGG